MRKLLLIIIITLLLPIIVWGNSGPPVIGPLDQSVIFDDSSGVSLLEEWVIKSSLHTVE